MRSRFSPSSQPTKSELQIRLCRDDENQEILEIVNAGAEAYRGVIPEDRWHEPYMSAKELAGEITAGVVFWGACIDDQLIAVMGIQSVMDVHLIRHAYVRPEHQRTGLGSAMMRHILDLTSGTVLVGTWETARWAIAFYERHGFVLVDPGEKALLLRRYWSIPERQVEVSVVLRR